MKNRTIKLFILLSIATLSLTACGKKTEPVNEAPEPTTVEETTAIEESEPVIEEEIPVEEEPADTEISSITLAEELNMQLYVVKESNILDADNNDAKIIAPVEFGAHLTVTGKTQNNWYQIDWAGTKGYLPADTLSDTNPAPETSQDPSEVIADDGRTAQEILDAYKEATGGMGDILDEEFGTPGEVQDMGPITEGNGYNSNW